MELQNFLQLLGHNVPFAIFVGVMGLLILLTFIFFMNSLGARSSSYTGTTGLVEANAAFIKELRDVSEQAKEVLSQLSSTVGEKDKEIREKAETLKKLDYQSKVLKKSINDLETQARTRTKTPALSWATLAFGLLLGVLLALSTFGVAYYFGIFKGLVEII